MLQPNWRLRSKVNELKTEKFFNGYNFVSAVPEIRAKWTVQEYLEKQPIFTQLFRSLIISQMRKISTQSQFRLPDLVFFSAIHILDTLMAADNVIKMEMKQLELIGLCCLDISANYHMLNSAPALSQYLTSLKEYTYLSSETILKTENMILKTIDWKIGTIHPYIMLHKMGFKQICVTELYNLLKSSEQFFIHNYDSIVQWMIDNKYVK
jgi:hypothetical protein